MLRWVAGMLMADRVIQAVTEANVAALFMDWILHKHAHSGRLAWDVCRCA